MEKKVPVDSNSSGHSAQKKLRICLDPRDLNKALQREPYYIQTIEEIPGKFHGMTQFSIADFNKGYWMVEFHPGLRKVTTMALDIGRFQWTWLPMGSIIAQDVFQRKLNSIFLDMPGVTGIADDMIILWKRWSSLQLAPTRSETSILTATTTTPHVTIHKIVPRGDIVTNLLSLDLPPYWC